MDQQEYKIWQTAKAQGKDDAFIKGAIQAYRSTKAQPLPATTPPGTVSHGGISLSAIGQGLTSAANGITDALGLSGVVDTFGSNIAQIQNAAQGIGGIALGNKAAVQDASSKAPYLPGATLGQNIGAGAQIAALTAPGIGQASLPLSTGAAATAGAIGGAGQAMTEKKNASDTVAQAGIGALTAGALNLAGSAISSLGKSAYKFIIPRSQREAQLLQTYRADVPFTDRIAAAAGAVASKKPTTLADTSFENGLLGTEAMLGVQAKKAQKNIWSNLIAPQLEKSSAKVQMDDFFNTLEDVVMRDNPELNRQADLLEAIQALREPYKNKSVPLTDLQSYKEGWAKFLPEKVYRGKPIAAAFNEVKTTAADLARGAIYDHLGPDVQKAYIDYGNLTGMVELGQKAMTGGRLKGGFGSFWSAIKDEILTPISTIGGMTVYTTGKGVQLIAPAGAQTVSDIMTSTSQQSPQQATAQTGSNPQTLENPSPNNSIPPGRVNPDGTITVKSPFNGKDITMDPAMGLGVEAKGVRIAKDVLKDGVMHLLEKGAPKLNNALNTKLTEEAATLLQHLKEQANPTMENLNRALEIAKLQGHDVAPIVKEYLQEAETAFKQIRDALGRFAK